MNAALREKAEAALLGILASAGALHRLAAAMEDAAKPEPGQPELAPVELQHAARTVHHECVRGVLQLITACGLAGQLEGLAMAAKEAESG